MESLTLNTGHDGSIPVLGIVEFHKSLLHRHSSLFHLTLATLKSLINQTNSSVYGQETNLHITDRTALDLPQILGYNYQPT